MSVVLVADDYEGTAELLAQLIEFTWADCKVLTAKNGLEALVHARTIGVDLAVLDIDMPILNGLEVAKALRQEGRNMILIAMSGRGDTTVLSSGLFDSVYTKPLTDGALTEMLVLLNSRR